ncbi:MAG: acetyltransferase [Micropepsaceae bacterium]
MTRRLIVFGASGHMKDVAFIVESRAGDWEFVGILDDNPALKGTTCADRPVLGEVSMWREFRDHAFVVAVGAPRARAAIVSAIMGQGAPEFATLVHAAANVSRNAMLGAGCMIGPGACVSYDATLGQHVIVNAGATIAHDDRIGDFCTIAPQVTLSGNVTLEDGVEVGTAAAIRQGTSVGRGAMIGMGSVVTRDVDANTCIIGNPARVLKMLPAFGKPS